MKSKIDQLAESMSNTAIQRLGEVDNNLQEVSRTIQETCEQAAEQREKEARRNIIICRMPESAANVVEQRRKDDHDFLFELMQNVLDTQCEADDVGKIVQLGKRQEGTNRPVLVELKSRSTKNIIMESLGKLKSADERFHRLSITHDMTHVKETSVNKWCWRQRTKSSN